MCSCTACSCSCCAALRHFLQLLPSSKSMFLCTLQRAARLVMPHSWHSPNVPVMHLIGTPDVTTNKSPTPRQDKTPLSHTVVLKERRRAQSGRPWPHLQLNLSQSRRRARILVVKSVWSEAARRRLLGSWMRQGIREAAVKARRRTHSLFCMMHRW